MKKLPAGPDLACRRHRTRPHQVQRHRERAIGYGDVLQHHRDTLLVALTGSIEEFELEILLTRHRCAALLKCVS
jgi:hypothetical protein